MNSFTLTPSLQENTANMDRLFENVDILIKREFENQHDSSIKFCLFCCDGVVNGDAINEYIIAPLMRGIISAKGEALLSEVSARFLTVGEVEESQSSEDVIKAVTYGDTIIFAEGCATALIINSKGFALRSSSEPEGEKVLAGPREGFTEGIMTNLSMLRRRIRSDELKLQFMTIGCKTNTSICICYMDDIVNKSILEELTNRLKTIKQDGILDSNYITEYISESSAMGFYSTGSTERPDIVAAKLLEGRIAIMVDGTPSVLTVPYIFIENFQSNEDYYLKSGYASFSRILRILGFILTITVPALYVAAVTHHQEILPTKLMIDFAAERLNVPLPAAVEAFIMLLMFDILRETGVRMPSYVGQAMSVVGALVIGQAAVSAKLVAAPMIIVVAFTGITNLLVPKLSTAALAARYAFLLLASCFGLLGLAAGISLLVTHILSLKSFGVPQMMPMENLCPQDMKDLFIRAPWPRMTTRLSPISQNKVRAVKVHK
ncbi:MAG: spore germination protein [Oscillospiraceae bacterium]|nr:spore germination protein [Oscillospiraceae bacterium]